MALFKKDKDQKKKGQEGLIGKIIYACLLFAPIFAVAVACMYVVFNKNAYQSYSQVTSYREYTNLNSVIGNQYKINFINNTEGQTNNSTAIIKFQTISVETPNGATQFRYANTSTITFFDSNGTSLGSTQNITTFTYVANDTNPLAQQPWFVRLLIVETTGKLDQVFYYQLEELEQSDLFNWSKNTGTYTVLKTTCEGLGISNDYTPMLLSYWLIISIMYFLYDIALILIWAVHDKIHELKESI